MAANVSESKPFQGQVFLASFIGTTIEQYDFLLYGTMAAVVFNKLFFPSLDATSGMLAALGTFAVGFLARPVGGIVCGHLGDRIGRKAILVLTLFIMGGATVLIGLMPTYATIGIWAPIGITILRFVQGLAFGGEQAGAILIAVESAPPDRRGFYGSWAQTGGFAGLVLCSSVVAGVSLLPEADFLLWGWRIPFLLSIFLVLIGVVARMRLPESPLFLEQRSIEQHSLPLVKLFREHKREIILVLGARLGEIAWAFLILTFVLAYVTAELKLPRSTVLSGLFFAAVTGVVTVPLFGALSDRIGRRILYLTGASLVILYVYPMFILLQTKDPLLIKLAIVVGLGIIHPMMYGPQAAFFSELFKTSTRYSGLSFGMQIAGALGGGLTPPIAAALLSWGQGGIGAIAIYIAVVMGVTILCVLASGDTRAVPLSETKSGRDMGHYPVKPIAMS